MYRDFASTRLRRNSWFIERSNGGRDFANRELSGALKHGIRIASRIVARGDIEAAMSLMARC
jgi:hypothetical protein